MSTPGANSALVEDLLDLRTALRTLPRSLVDKVACLSVVALNILDQWRLL